MKNVIIIGAGMAGVTAGRELSRAGFSVTIVEGRNRIGGRVHSIRNFCDRPVEAGAEFVHGINAATWPEIAAAGFGVRPCPLIRHTMFNVGGGTRWLPFILMHPGVWPAFTIMRHISRFRPPDISAAEFIAQRGYTGRAQVLAAMTLSAHLPGSVDEIGLQGLVEDGVLKLETGLNHRITEGYDSLARFIAYNLDIRLDFTVKTIKWQPDGVMVVSNDGQELSGQAAVTTLPVGVLNNGNITFIPELSLSKKIALDRLVMGPVVKILLLFKENFWPQWAANICCGTGPVTLYWPISYRDKQGPPVLTAYATGPRAARLSAASEEEALSLVLDNLNRLFPKVDAGKLLVNSRRIDCYADPYSRGGYTFIKPGGCGARALLAASDTPPLFWAGSATVWSPIAATVEAAYTSGLRAAKEVIHFLIK